MAISKDTAGVPASRTAVSPRRRLGLLLFLGSIIVSFLAASSAPTPLYAVYAAHWGFSPLATTVVFGVYAVAVLAALLTFGRLSDHIGRRPVLLAGLVLQAVAMVVFARAGDLGTLLAARVVQGIAAGSSLGAIGAAMLDLDRRRGALANSFAPGLGSGAGALLSGLAVQFLPAPTHLIYLALLGVFGIQAVGVLVMRETAPRRAGGWRSAAASLVPEVRLPRETRSEIFIAAPVLFAVWALAGFYGSLGPALTATLLHSSAIVYGGLSLFVLAGVAALAVLAFNRVDARRALFMSIGALVAGVAVTLAATATDSVASFFIGTAIAGAGFGGGFQGGLRTIVPLAEPTERAGVISVAYIICYLAMGLPAILAGFLVVHGTVLHTALQFGGAVIVLAGLTVAGMTLSAVRSRARRPAACPVIR